MQPYSAHAVACAARVAWVNGVGCSGCPTGGGRVNTAAGVAVPVTVVVVKLAVGSGLTVKAAEAEAPLMMRELLRHLRPARQEA